MPFPLAVTMNSEFSETSSSSPLQPRNDLASAASGVNVDVRIPLNSPSPPPPLARRTTVSATAGREEERNDNNNKMSSPPLLKRRAISYDDDGAGENSARRGDAARATRHSLGANMNNNAKLALRTIPSRCEMDDDDDDDDNSIDENNNPAAMRRRTLFATPRTRVGFSPQEQLPNQLPDTSHAPPSNNIIQNRSRAVSSDIVLNIHSVNDCLPRYDDDFASRIANISEEHLQGRGRGSFSTPERQITRPTFNRDRANTCPHRPQRHSIFELEGGEQVEGDEESGQLNHSHSEMEGGSLPAHEGISSSTPGRTLSPEEAMDSRNSSPERRSHSSSSSPRRTTQSPYATPSSSARRAIPPRPPYSSSQSTSNVVTSSNVGIPSSPQINGRLSRSRALSTGSTASSTPIIMTATQQAHQQAESCLFRINPYIMKALMVISLYMTLAYTWNTDLQFRYKSMEINYGLSEYWHGGLSSRVGAAEKIGRNNGKLFNDDGDERDDNLAKLLNGLDGEDDKILEDSASGDSSSDVSSFQRGASASSKKRRPSLSHARSLTDSSHPAYGVQRIKAARRPPPSKWTFSRLAWAMVWMGLMLPIVEASIREVRRQINFRFWNVRRLRSFRAMPSRVPSNRVHSVHNL